MISQRVCEIACNRSSESRLWGQNENLAFRGLCRLRPAADMAHGAQTCRLFTCADQPRSHATIFKTAKALGLDVAPTLLGSRQ
jgi:hypothetical protein